MAAAAAASKATATAAGASVASSSSSAPKKLPRLIDVGANMLDEMFLGKYHGKQRHAPDFDAVINRALKVGVGQLIITAGTLDESVAAAEMARKLGCYSTVGCHPTRCREFLEKAPTPEQYLAKLRAVAEKYSDVVVAIGECGLDYDRLFFCPKEVQLRCFPLQIMLAAELKLPLFLHNRNTGTDFADICAKHKDALFGMGGVVHSFAGGLGELQTLQGLGFYISLNGCSFKEEGQLEVARAVQLNRLMLETDAWHRLLLGEPAVAQMLAKDFAADFPDLVSAEAALPAVKKAERYEALKVRWCLSCGLRPHGQAAPMKVSFSQQKAAVTYEPGHINNKKKLVFSRGTKK